MSPSSSYNPMFRTAFYRTVWLPAAIATALLLVALILLVGSAWRSAQRLQPVHDHLTLLSQLQDKRLLIEEILVAHLGQDKALDHQDLAATRDQIRALARRSDYLDPDTLRALKHADRAIGGFSTHPKAAVVSSLAELRRALALETKAHNALLDDVNRAAHFELRIASTMLVFIPLLTALLLFLVRKRVLHPLRDLSRLMTLLSSRDYTTIAVGDADPMLRPLLGNYNEMVTQLATLERDRQARQASLEAQVHHASSALLDQQRKLADTERLAAVGELAASIAHDLRNPLAGIQVALANLRRETTDADHIQRLDLVTQELSRITALLNSLLDQARHQPEPATEIRLSEVVRDLLALTRYQIPPHISIEQQIADDIVCYLPIEGLRQAILNLVLNACDALGEAEGSIRVSAGKEGDKLVVSVRDDGPGFPAELLSVGIRPFSSTRAGGTGLGLSIVRRFANAVSGEITLHNMEPHGACVTLRMPCTRSEHD